jgi:hypothetical protein
MPSSISYKVTRRGHLNSVGRSATEHSLTHSCTDIGYNAFALPARARRWPAQGRWPELLGIFPVPGRGQRRASDEASKQQCTLPTWRKGQAAASPLIKALIEYEPTRPPSNRRQIEINWALLPKLLPCKWLPSTSALAAATDKAV